MQTTTTTRVALVSAVSLGVGLAWLVARRRSAAQLQLALVVEPSIDDEKSRTVAAISRTRPAIAPAGSPAPQPVSVSGAFDAVLAGAAGADASDPEVSEAGVSAFQDATRKLFESHREVKREWERHEVRRITLTLTLTLTIF